MHGNNQADHINRTLEIASVTIFSKHPHFELAVNTLSNYAILAVPLRILLSLSVSTCAVIGQFSGPCSPVRPAKIYSCFFCQFVS